LRESDNTIKFPPKIRSNEVKMTDISQRLKFIREAERLKNVLRLAHTSEGRQESTAEHTWRLCLLAMVFEDLLPGLDFAKVLKMCVVHDLGEAIHGDVPAVMQGSRLSENAEIYLGWLKDSHLNFAMSSCHFGTSTRPRHRPKPLPSRP
jgi:HD domain